VPDGIASGSFDTYLKNAVGSNIKMTISNSKGAMYILDSYNRSANVIMAQSNNLSNRCVIHLLDNYLKYNDN
jgi:hypothetical protein